MTLLAVAMALLVGAVVGVVSGLLGIGGGILMVPFLYLLMGSTAWSGLEVPVEHQAALAHATSLAVIVPAALSGLLAFRRMNLIPWGAILPLAVAAAFAALLGARVAIALPGPVLKLVFGLFLLASSRRLLRGREGPDEASAEERRVRWTVAVPGGGAVGLLSALLGIGGGIVAIPILIRWVGLELHRVVPTSIAIIAFAAPAGVLAYALAGPVPGLPGGAVGYVHLPSALAMAPGAALLAPVGARWNRRLGTRALRLALGALLLVFGVQLIWANTLLLVR